MARREVEDHEDTPSLEHPFMDFVASESHESPSERAYYAWVKKVEKLLGHSLDGDQDRDGYSLDFASDCFDAGDTPEQYVADVRTGQQIDADNIARLTALPA